ncbi:MAG: hypothetical protein JNG89_05135 [Planctomycetaceae bacterium]|nr:hypothetical protein [Planctomycetaceae bacterium]
MSRLFVANLNFERQIAGDRRNLPLDVHRRSAELAACWLPLCQPGDAVWCSSSVPKTFWIGMAELGLSLVRGVDDAAAVPPNLALVPWGWTEELRRFGQQVRANVAAPPDGAVVRANSRRFACELETRWDVGLPGARAVTSHAELGETLRNVGPHARWVIKSEFSSAARQRIVGTGPVPDQNSAGWINKRLAAGEWLAYEPWVERVREAGLQWTVPPTGPPVLDGIAELLTGPAGNYLGSAFGLSVAERAVWQPAIEVQQRAVDAIQQTGYFGPVGIDAMLYRGADGVERLRPLQDINARWTMGRLALEWQRILPAGVWRHGTAAEFAERSLLKPTLIRTSPDIVGGQPAQTATWLEPQGVY